jgi:hypothetical protein
MCVSLIREEELCKNRKCVTCKKLGERCNDTRVTGELFCKVHTNKNIINELFNPRENSPVKAVMTNILHLPIILKRKQFSLYKSIWI